MRHYINFNLKILHLLSIWTESAPTIRESKHYWKYTLFVNIFLSGFFNVGTILFVLANTDDVELLAGSTFIALMTNMGTIKAYVFVKNEKVIKKLIKSLENDNSLQCENEDQIRIADRVMKRYKVLYWTFQTLGILLWTAWISIPLHSKNKALPFLSWYPYDWTESFWYEFSYVHQSISILYTGLQNVNLDAFFTGFMGYVVAECEMLSYSLRNLHHLTEPKKFQAHKNMEGALIECIVHYKKIIWFSRNISRFLNIMVFAQFAVSVLSFCMILLVLTTSSSGVIYNVAVYQIAISIELLMYCWFGNEITEKSLSISLAMYEGPWIERSSTFKRNLLFFMQRVQRPIKMYAIGFFEVSLTTFTSIYRHSWSVFLLLRQIYDDDS